MYNKKKGFVLPCSNAASMIYYALCNTAKPPKKSNRIKSLKAFNKSVFQQHQQNQISSQQRCNQAIVQFLTCPPAKQKIQKIQEKENKVIYECRIYNTIMQNTHRIFGIQGPGPGGKTIFEPLTPFFLFVLYVLSHTLTNMHEY